MRGRYFLVSPVKTQRRMARVPDTKTEFMTPGEPSKRTEPGINLATTGQSPDELRVAIKIGNEKSALKSRGGT